MSNHDGSSSGNNPLKLFPSKSDSITKAFFGVSIPKRRRRLEGLEKWLNPEHIDPNFGLKGRTHEDSLRRAFRRVSSSQLFNQMSPKDVNLSELQLKPLASYSSGKKFVLVEESALAEVTNFENILRDEKEKIGEQCAWLLTDVHIDLHIPIPATRLAFHNICESQMRKSASDIMKLNEQWIEFRKKNHYDRPPIFQKESYLKSAPLSQRAMKLKLVREASVVHEIRKERDTMQYEDDLSYLIGKYEDAQQRKVDYDRYFILSTRYGLFSEAQFYKDNTPGFRYWKRVTLAAVKYQKLWNRYWSVAKIKRFLSARMLQKVWRRYWALKVWKPIIRLRMKMGKRTYFRFCWNLWIHYNKIVRKIKNALKSYRENCIGLCFFAWKKSFFDEKNRKLEVLKKFTFRIKYGFVELCFRAWITYIKKCLEVKRKARRLMQNPHFEKWVRYVDWTKHMRRLNTAATKLQSISRMHFALKRRSDVLHAFTRIRKVIRMFKSLIVVKAARRKFEVVDYEAWKVSELMLRVANANDREKQRLARLQIVLDDKAKKACAELKRHLRSRDGKFQLKELAKSAALQHAVGEDKRKVAERELLKRCTEVNKSLARHDFLTKSPAPFKCADPCCSAIFTTVEQYHEHARSSPKHATEGSFLFSHLHVMILSAQGINHLNKFVHYKEGVTNLSNCLEFWVAVQDFRKQLSTNAKYNDKLVTIYDRFFSAGCDRSVDFSAVEPSLRSEISKMIDKLEAVKYRSFDGFYHEIVANRSVARAIFGLQGKEYVAWTENQVFLPTDIDQAEWLSFRTIFQFLTTHFDAFYDSIFGKDYQKHVESVIAVIEKALRNDYAIAKKEKFRKWAEDYKYHELLISRKALEVANQSMRLIIDDFFAEISRNAVNEFVKETSYSEQCVYESVNMKVDDALSWTEINLFEEFWSFYVPTMLNSMLEVPDFRKGMMEYAGMIKLHLKKTLQIDLKRKNDGKEWFDNMFKNAAKEEETIRPLKPEKAVLFIQNMYRCYVGRRNARKRFTQVYGKRYDPAAAACYYINLRTGETSWERPLVAKLLFPKSVW